MFAEAVPMNPHATTIRREAQARSESFAVKRNFQPGKSSADMVRRLLMAHRAA